MQKSEIFILYSGAAKSREFSQNQKSNTIIKFGRGFDLSQKGREDAKKEEVWAEAERDWGQGDREKPPPKRCLKATPDIDLSKW